MGVSPNFCDLASTFAPASVRTRTSSKFPLWLAMCKIVKGSTSPYRKFRFALPDVTNILATSVLPTFTADQRAVCPTEFFMLTQAPLDRRKVTI